MRHLNNAAYKRLNQIPFQLDSSGWTGTEPLQRSIIIGSKGTASSDASIARRRDVAPLTGNPTPKNKKPAGLPRERPNDPSVRLQADKFGRRQAAEATSRRYRTGWVMPGRQTSPVSNATLRIRAPPDFSGHLFRRTAEVPAAF